MEITILGGAQLTALAARCRTAGNGMQQELVTGIERSVTGFEPAIQANIPPTMPKGYEPVLSGSLRVRVARRSTGVLITVDARARKGLRALGALDKGLLRHPIYGRMRRTRRGWRPNPWASQAVKPRVVTKPFEEMEPKILDELAKVIEAVARKVAG